MKLVKTITIPEVTIYSEKFGGNLIVRLANKTVTAEVEIFNIESSSFYELKTKLSAPFDKFYLKKPRTKLLDHKGRYYLKIKDGVSLKDLDQTTKLQWTKNPLEDCNCSPDEIVQSWLGKFEFKEELPEFNQSGLRKPQLGALHSISAHFATDQIPEPATVVLPTGTGKTETMLATLLYQRCNKVLVIVPSSALRDQVSNKFITLGYLQDLGIVGFNLKMPYVAKITKGIHTAEIAKNIVQNSNVIVATASIINASTPEVIDLLCRNCSHLFIDEAHHISANTWLKIRDRFKDKRIIQFTATPFRNDGKTLGGRIIYNYTMGEAQRAGYFMTVHMQSVEEYNEGQADSAIAQIALKKLREDLKNELNHLLLARVSSKIRAEEVFKIYQRFASDLRPIMVHSGHSDAEVRKKLNKLQRFESKIVVCIDMMGEGYDLPNLKIAAIHDHHKSLAITLQFIGRFTRIATNQNIGAATAVVNIADSEIENELRELYSQDADWGIILRKLSERRIQKEVRLQEIVDSLKAGGELHNVISLWNIKPSLSAMLFNTECLNWEPYAYINDLPNFDKHWHAISEEMKLIVVLAINSTPVKWGVYKDLRDVNYKLLIAYWCQERKTLTVFSNDYDVFRLEKLAKNICGENTNVFSGERIFNVFNNIEYPLVRNLGGSQIGAISFTQFFGPNVTEGLGRIEQAELNLSNIATMGYEEGNKVLWGCSEKKGKIWSPQACDSISSWCEWVDYAWDKISQGNNIGQKNITRDFLKPKRITSRYDQLPLSVQWGEHIQSSYEDTVKITFGSVEIPFYLIDLSIEKPSKTGHLRIKISTENESSIYEQRINEQPPNFEYNLVEGKPVGIVRGCREAQDFIEYMNTDPIYINYIDGSFSYNCFLIKVTDAIGLYPKDDLEVGDWRGINIKSESMGKNNKQDTVQRRTYERIVDDYEIIINDDGNGEAADLIALKQGENEIIMNLIHCKYSSELQPGARVSDLYEVCGQVQRSIRWKHTGFMTLYKRIKHREKLWQNTGHSRFLKGTMNEISNLKNRSRRMPIKCKFTIVQPGVSASRVSEEMLRLLGSTAQYIRKTTQADLTVIVSE